jgi:hypothetical protein
MSYNYSKLLTSHTQMRYKYLNEAIILKLRCVVAAAGSSHVWVQDSVDEVVSHPADVV